MAVIGETAIVGDAGQGCPRGYDRLGGTPDESDRPELTHRHTVRVAKLAREVDRVNAHRVRERRH